MRNTKKNILNYLVIILFLTASCSNVPSVPVCRPITTDTGFCSWTIENKDMIVSDENKLYGKTWIDLKIESIYVPVESWIEIKKYIIKQCKKNNDCNSEIDSWTRKIDSVIPK